MKLKTVFGIITTIIFLGTQPSNNISIADYIDVSAEIIFFTPDQSRDVGLSSLVILNPITRQEQRVDLTSDVNEPTRLAWSPNYSEIAISHMATSRQHYAMVAYNVSNGKMKTLAESSGRDVFAGRYNADGTKIFFTRGALANQPYTSELYTLTFTEDGASARLITDKDLIITDAFWSPSDGHLAVTGITFASKQNTEDGTAGDIFVIDLARKHIHNVTKTPFQEYFTNWSPDGSAFAYISDETGKQEAHVMDANGRNQRQVTQNPLWVDDAQWTRDGEALIFLAVNRSGSSRKPWQLSQLVLHDLDTGQELVLVEKTRISRFDLSPDIDQLAYISRTADDEPSLLCVLDIASREEWCAEHEALESSGIAWGID